jgi:hypothetical protein
MIVIRLLGPIQKILNSKIMYLHKNETSIPELMSFLREKAMVPNNIDQKNFVIAINGIESSLISQDDSAIKSGDTVTIASLIHGG